jgi:hypothetical protein
VYLDLHKTGSTTLARFFKKEVMGPTYTFQKHRPAAELEKQETDLWLMSVRNPLDYYVSLWAWGRKKHRRVYDAIDPSMRGALYGNPDPATFRRWLVSLFDSSALALDASREPVTPIGHSVRHASRAGIGFFTLRYLVLSTTGPNLPAPRRLIRKNFDLEMLLDEHSRVDRYLRLESVHDDLEEIAMDSRVRLNGGALERLRLSRPFNPSAHGLALSYYDQETYDLVVQRDRLILHRHYGSVA